MSMIRDILMYMDRNYSPIQKKLPSFSLSFKIFKDIVIYHPNILDRLRNLLLDNILAERQGIVIDRHEMKVVLEMLQDVGITVSTGSGNSFSVYNSNSVYEDEFESYFLIATSDFYRSESLSFIAEVSIR